MSGGTEHDRRIVEQFTKQVDRFVHSPHVNEPTLVERFLAVAAPLPSERAIDVACGPGLLALAFAPRLGSYVGVDLTPAMVAKARELCEAARVRNVRFEVGEALALPFPEGSFDLALSRLSLHHMPDPAAALCEISRVLSISGRAAIFDMTTSEDVDEAALHTRIERLRDPTHVRALPISELCRLIERAHLDLVRLETADYAMEVEDWLARAAQPAEAAEEARRLIACALGTRRFGGKRVYREADGKLCFTVRYAMAVARRRE